MGKVHVYAVLWTQITNETDHPFELTIDFPVDTFELQSSVGRHFRLLIPSDTMTLDKVDLFNYGLDLGSFLDYNIQKPSALKRTINPKESTGFYVVTLFNKSVNGNLRTGLSINEEKLFYRVNEKEIDCGKINLKGLKLRE